MKRRSETQPFLHQKLLTLTGFSDHACWRKLQKHGIRRPGAGKRVQWNPKAVNFVTEQGYDAAVQKFNTSKKAGYRFMQRNQRSMGSCRGQYSLTQLRKLLSARIETISGWIRAGYLEASPFQYGGKETHIVSDEQLRKFLKTYSGDLMPRRLPEKRLAFLSKFPLRRRTCRAWTVAHPRKQKGKRSVSKRRVPFGLATTWGTRSAFTLVTLALPFLRSARIGSVVWQDVIGWPEIFGSPDISGCLSV